jgi:hypothetical protein
MRTASLRTLTVLLMLILGCSDKRENDMPIPFEKVPPTLVKIASERLPGVSFQTAYKETKGGKDVYELRGKTKEGKIRDLEITADGEVIEVD